MYTTLSLMSINRQVTNMCWFKIPNNPCWCCLTKIVPKRWPNWNSTFNQKMSVTFWAYILSKSNTYTYTLKHITVTINYLVAEIRRKGIFFRFNASWEFLYTSQWVNWIVWINWNQPSTEYIELTNMAILFFVKIVFAEANVFICEICVLFCYGIISI